MIRSQKFIKTVNIKDNQFCYSISVFYDKCYWRKCRMMTFRLLSRLKKSGYNIERLIDSTRFHSNKNNLKAAARRCSSK